jgi:hypothetical protein
MKIGEKRRGERKKEIERYEERYLLKDRKSE